MEEDLDFKVTFEILIFLTELFDFHSNFDTESDRPRDRKLATYELSSMTLYD